jgi:hypothetical protein
MPIPERKGTPDLALDEAIFNYNFSETMKHPPDTLLNLLDLVQIALADSKVVLMPERIQYQQYLISEMQRLTSLPTYAGNTSSSSSQSSSIFGTKAGRNRTNFSSALKNVSTSNNTTSTPTITLTPTVRTNASTTATSTTASTTTASTTIITNRNPSTATTTSEPGFDKLPVGMKERWEETNLKGGRKKQREKYDQKLRLESAKYAKFVSEFQRGKDLVYGLAMPRGKYVLALDDDYDTKALPDIANLRIQPKADMDFVIIDTFNNAFLGTEVFNSAAPIFAGSKLTQQQRTGSEAYLGQLPNEHAEVKSFREFLERTYELDSIKASSKANQMMRYGRACKAGLTYAATARNGRVHFVLDEVDMTRVLADVNNPKHERNITGKELRWLYRHRNDTQIMASVKFWRDGQPCAAPWDDPAYKTAWEQYGTSRSTKTKI